MSYAAVPTTMRTRDHPNSNRENVRLGHTQPNNKISSASSASLMLYPFDPHNLKRIHAMPEIELESQRPAARCLCNTNQINTHQSRSHSDHDSKLMGSAWQVSTTEKHLIVKPHIQKAGSGPPPRNLRHSQGLPAILVPCSCTVRHLHHIWRQISASI